MSIEFSAESLFVASNWDTVRELIEAAKQLGDQMQRFVLSLEGDLRSRDWWSEAWTFRAYDAGQVYIAREVWRSRSDHAIWMGVRQFRPGNVFGLEDAPEVYVWVSWKQFELARRLSDLLAGPETVGDLDLNWTNGYVVRQPVQKCLPDGVDEYLAAAREQILAFLDHYAALAPDWDVIVSEHLSS